jgi:hypothetical protein
LLGRIGADDGPTFELVVGAVTPQFDRVQFAAHSIAADSDGFEVEFEGAPNLLNPAAPGELPVAWWARDDRGNHYLGQPNGWSGSDAHVEGTLRYWPALDPRAKRLELLVGATTQQAVVSIALARTVEADP